VTGLSANPSSAFESARADGLARFRLDANTLHLWFCHRDTGMSSNAFCRAALSRHAPVAPRSWRFATGEHGKPRLVRAPLPLDFNLSHSGDWMVCAVSAGTPVGVDIELDNSSRNVMRLSRRFFSPAETADIEALPEDARRERFYDYWTLKEATVKAFGGALGPALGKAAFRLSYSSESDCGRIFPAGDAGQTVAQHYLVRVGGGLAAYSLALCVAGVSAVPMAFRVHTLPDGGPGQTPALTVRASSGIGDFPN